MFYNFPHRHGDATGKPATRDKAHGCRKTRISYENSSIFRRSTGYQTSWNVRKLRQPRQKNDDLLGKHSKRTGFPASPIDTATPQENQRLETRQMDAEKPAFHTKFLPFFTVGNNTKRTRFAASPITRRGHGKTRPARRDRWEHQNEHFVRDFLRFPSHFVASKSTFSCEFSLEHENWQYKNRCFVRGFH